VSRPKVAHITTIDQSLELLLLHQLQSLQQAGYEVVGISAPGPSVPKLTTAGIRHIPIPLTRTVSPLADLVALWRLWRIMRRERFAIVHTHTPKPGLLGQLAARLAGVPVVINTLHGFYFHAAMRPATRRFYIALERLAARCSDAILSQNHEDIATALRERICRPAQIKHLGNGIDLGGFDPARFPAADLARRRAALGIPPDAPVVGFVGRLAARRKGFLDFLAAAARVAEQLPQVRFLIVGEADHGKPDAVEPAAAQGYGIADRCHFLGGQPNDALPPLYRLMDLLVLPSLFEGLPRVIMEAAAMGTPAVVTDVKGNREAVVPDRNGLRVPLGDVPALTDAILALLRDPARAARLGAAGRAMALEEFDEQAVFRLVRAEYARLLAAKGVPLPPVPEQVGETSSRG
jgi:glycosyltransferase involved in cell wall biosynthesis